jgi:hypothetical protein
LPCAISKASRGSTPEHYFNSVRGESAQEKPKPATIPPVKQTLNADDGARILKTMSDLANGLERQAYEQLKKANQYPAGSTLRKLKEKHAKELLREVKRLRAKENKG